MLTDLHVITGKVLRVISPKLYAHITTEHTGRHALIQALIEFQEALINNINPKRMWNELKHIFKKYGIKIGIIVAFIEIFDHFGLPLLLAFLGWHKLAVVLTALPISEIFVYPLILLWVRKSQ